MRTQIGNPFMLQVDLNIAVSQDSWYCLYFCEQYFIKVCIYAYTNFY